MASKKDFFTAHSKLVEKYMAGTRTNSMICTTMKVAKKLEAAYNVDLKKSKTVDQAHGLYMFEIVKKE